MQTSFKTRLVTFLAVLGMLGALNGQVSVPAGEFKYLKPNIVNDTNNLAAAYQAYRSGQISKEEIMAVTLATLNDEPISFYGKLEDQFSNPVATASINLSLKIYNGIDSTTERGQVLSDAKGFFRISGYHGESLGMMPRKEGYVLATIGTFFKYSRLDQDYFVPNSNSPVLIKMWKTQGAEPLVGIGNKYKLPYTNAPLSFDLLTGALVPTGGDIRLTIDRPPGVISGREPQVWSVTFEAAMGDSWIPLEPSGLHISHPRTATKPLKPFFRPTHCQHMASICSKQVFTRRVVMAKSIQNSE